MEIGSNLKVLDCVEARTNAVPLVGGSLRLKVTTVAEVLLPVSLFLGEPCCPCPPLQIDGVEEGNSSARPVKPMRDQHRPSDHLLVLVLKVTKIGENLALK